MQRKNVWLKYVQITQKQNLAKRKSRERSKMVDNIIREVMASCTIAPFRELDKFAAALRREVDNTIDFCPVDFM